jgi:hypothetical protein
MFLDCMDCKSDPDAAGAGRRGAGVDGWVSGLKLDHRQPISARTITQSSLALLNSVAQSVEMAAVYMDLFRNVVGWKKG